MGGSLPASMVYGPPHSAPTGAAMDAMMTINLEVVVVIWPTPCTLETWGTVTRSFFSAFVCFLGTWAGKLRRKTISWEISGWVDLHLVKRLTRWYKPTRRTKGARK